MNKETENKINDILKNYNINGKCIKIEENHTGNINSTYVVTMLEDSGIVKRYIIQKINTTVFKDPNILMHNIENVTLHLESELKSLNDTTHKALHLIRTKDDDIYCHVTETDDRDYYRVYDYIENAISYDMVKNPDIAYKVGQAFGNFQMLLRDFPIFSLEETIPGFHDTPARYAKLENDIFKDFKKRADDIGREFYMIYRNKNRYNKIINALRSNRIPWRVTHNDTKVNNVMIDKDTNEFLAVIDLDTVMPGSMLFDYGDGIRSTAATAFENETDLSKVHLDLELFEAYTDGFLSEIASYISESEVALMGESIRIITLELAIRFLDDYICGDIYFKVDPKRSRHNLERAQNQLALAKDIEKNMPTIENFIKECYKKHKGKSRKII